MTAIPQTFTSRAYHVYQSAINLAAKVVEISGPILQDVALRLQQVFQHTLPYLHAIGDFLKTNLGVASVAILGACLVIQLSEYSSSMFLRSTLFISGIALAVIGGVFIAHSGILPMGLIPLTV